MLHLLYHPASIPASCDLLFSPGISPPPLHLHDIHIPSYPLSIALPLTLTSLTPSDSPPPPISPPSPTPPASASAATSAPGCWRAYVSPTPADGPVRQAPRWNQAVYSLIESSHQLPHTIAISSPSQRQRGRQGEGKGKRRIERERGAGEWVQHTLNQLLLLRSPFKPFPQTVRRPLALEVLGRGLERPGNICVSLESKV